VSKTSKRKHNRGSQRAKQSVGIFYLMGGKLWLDATPLPRAGSFGEFAIHERDHIFYWEELVSGGRVAHGEYDEHPRGRVAYNTKTGKFLFLADRCILRRKNLAAAIVRRLNLPSKETEIKTDAHYRCARCLRQSRSISPT